MVTGVAQVSLQVMTWCHTSNDHYHVMVSYCHMVTVLGNNGQPPVDDIDACCEEHDNCYDSVMTSGSCELPHPMLVSYSWSVVNGNHEDGGTLVCDDCATDPG